VVAPPRCPVQLPSRLPRSDSSPYQTVAGLIRCAILLTHTHERQVVLCICALGARRPVSSLLISVLKYCINAKLFLLLSLLLLPVLILWILPDRAISISPFLFFQSLPVWIKQIFRSIMHFHTLSLRGFRPCPTVLIFKIGLCRRCYEGDRSVANYHLNNCRPTSTQLTQGYRPPNLADLLQDRGKNHVAVKTSLTVDDETSIAVCVRNTFA
jgi:hypothetical protein